MIKLIVAMREDGLIGNGNKMPWHIKEEFIHFKNTTMGHTLFMGGNTFKGLPGKLPGRKISVFDFKEVEGADKCITSLEEAKEYINSFKDSKETLFIAGGKFVYETFADLADEWIVSIVKTDVKGNVFLDLDLESRSEELILKAEEFDVYKFKR